MRKTKGVSVFPVAFSGGLSMEGPVCENGKAVKWIASFAPQRYLSITVHVTQIATVGSRLSELVGTKGCLDN